jgi:hypothetical protein
MKLSKNVKRYPASLLIISTLTFLGCNPSVSEESGIIDSGQSTEYVVDIKDSLVIGYSRSVNDVLVEDVRFDYSYRDSVVTRVYTDENELVTRKTYYFIGSNKCASSSIDTIINGTANYMITIANYEYNSDTFLISSFIKWRNTLKPSDSGSYTMRYNYEAENLLNYNRYSTDNPAGCQTRYEYATGLNKVDLNFLSGICGKQSKNIVQRIIYNVGCETSSTEVPAESNFEYLFNDSKYVIEIKEYDASSYDTKERKSVAKTLFETYFTYRNL